MHLQIVILTCGPESGIFLTWLKSQGKYKILHMDTYQSLHISLEKSTTPRSFKVHDDENSNLM